MEGVAKTIGVLGFAAALPIGLAASADAQGRLHNLCGWSVRSPQEAFDRLAKQQKIREIQRTQFYISFHEEVAGGSWRIWTFTLADHPAHPAAICRYETLDDGSFTLRMNVVCGASKPVCDELVRQFQEHDRKITKD